MPLLGHCPVSENLMSKEADIKIRAFILIILFGFIGYIVHHGKTVKPVPIKRPLAEFPRQIGKWHVDRVITSPDAVVEMLGVTDYINFDYVDSAGRHVDLYVGYYHAVGVEVHIIPLKTACQEEGGE
jgi:hypothetical protein